MAEQVVLGLDIGTNRIKFVEARMGRHGPLITNAGMGLTPRNAISNGVIVDPNSLGAALRHLLDQYGIRTKGVVSSVASQSSLVVRPIEVPRMSRQELADTMQWEVERHIPFAASEVVMDFQPLIPPEDLPPEAQNMEVLLAVAQEDMINAHVDALFRAGLDPIALDVEPLAASRSLIDINREAGAYDHVYALLNVGAITTDLSIVRRGLLSFTRPVPLAGDNITNAIAEGLGYEFHEAERAKIEQAALYVQGAPALEAPREPQIQAPPPSVAPSPTQPIFRVGDEDREAKAAPIFDIGDEAPKPGPVFDLGAEPDKPQTFDLGADTGPGGPSGPQPPPRVSGLPVLHTPGAGTPGRQVYDAMLPTLVELVTEIRRSIEYYSNRYPDSRVDKVLVYGGTACMPNFAEFLAGEVGTAVEVGNALLRVEIDRGVSSEFIDQNGPYLPIVVGLAIRDMID
jgi:type IV pilus assembly protein PilM